MELKQVLEHFGQEQVPSDEMTGAFLEDCIGDFALDPAGAAIAIRQLQARNPRDFILAAVRLLGGTEEKSPGAEHVARLLCSGDVLITALIDKRMLALETAAVLARNLAKEDPLLDVRLVQRMPANTAGDICTADAETALRVLSLAAAISDCSRLTSYLVQLMRHPSAHVRSKVALLLGRANLNLGRVKSFMTSEDARLRANTLESLWGWRDASILTALREASRDRHGRVAVNALLGLCLVGDLEAYGRLRRLAAAPDASIRRGAAWAMGELGNPDAVSLLATMEQDTDEGVRAMAARSLTRLKAPPGEFEAAALPAEKHEASDSSPAEPTPADPAPADVSPAA